MLKTRLPISLSTIIPISTVAPSTEYITKYMYDTLYLILINLKIRKRCQITIKISKKNNIENNLCGMLPKRQIIKIRCP